MLVLFFNVFVGVIRTFHECVLRMKICEIKCLQLHFEDIHKIVILNIHHTNERFCSLVF